MGSSLMDQYVEDVMNPALPPDRVISVRQVDTPTHPPLRTGRPTIFYGRRRSTHFTCTVDGIHVFDSYLTGIQKHATDHFCQTFALLYMQSALFGGNWYNDLRRGHYMHNAWVAKEYACHVVRSMDREFDISSYVEQAIQEGNHRVTTGFTLNKLLRYCERLTLHDMESSSFYHQVFLS